MSTLATLDVEINAKIGSNYKSSINAVKTDMNQISMATSNAVEKTSALNNVNLNSIKGGLFDINGAVKDIITSNGSVSSSFQSMASTGRLAFSSMLGPIGLVVAAIGFVIMAIKNKIQADNEALKNSRENAIKEIIAINSVEQAISESNTRILGLEGKRYEQSYASARDRYEKEIDRIDELRMKARASGEYTLAKEEELQRQDLQARKEYDAEKKSISDRAENDRIKNNKRITDDSEKLNKDLLNLQREAQQSNATDRDKELRLNEDLRFEEIELASKKFKSEKQFNSALAAINEIYNKKSADINKKYDDIDNKAMEEKLKKEQFINEIIISSQAELDIARKEGLNKDIAILEERKRKEINALREILGDTEKFLEAKALVEEKYAQEIADTQIKFAIKAQEEQEKLIKEREKNKPVTEVLTSVSRMGLREAFNKIQNRTFQNLVEKNIEKYSKLSYDEQVKQTRIMLDRLGFSVVS